MPVFDDPKKELQKLQDQLLKDEAWFERELDSAKRMIGEMPEKKKSTPAPAPARTETPRVSPRMMGMVQEEPEEEAEPPQKGIRGLVILAALETLGIVGIVAYWLLFLLK